jgi:hypothetical protein
VNLHARRNFMMTPTITVWYIFRPRVGRWQESELRCEGGSSP